MVALPFDLFWRDHGVSRGLQGLGKDAATSRKHVETLGDHGKKLVGAFAGFAAAEVFRGFINDARESAKISRVTEQVIRSTGGAAHVTASQVGDLATSISNKTGADDEAIQSGENMLLTFTGVRNEVGKGNDIFNQASASAVDLAAAMNNGEVTTDGMKTASIQLGKALQDPIKGVGALSKVGVSFTAQQKEQIKAMVASGNVMGAQKIILGELNKEFGGTAKAAADPMQRLTVIMGNLGEQVGGAVLPAMNDFADFMSNTGAPALSAFVGVLSHVPAPAYAVIAGLVGIAGAVKAGHKVLETYRQVAEATSAAMKILGLRVGQAAAAEVVEAGAAKSAAVSTAAAGDAAAAAGIKFGALVGVLGGVGIALAAVPVANWLSDTAVAKVNTDELSASVANLGTAGDVGFRKLFNRAGWGDFKIDAQSSAEALDQFQSSAAIAFGSNWTDRTERMLTFGSVAHQAEGQIRELDGSLAALVQQGKLGEAQDAFHTLAQRMRDAGVAEQDIQKAFPQYYAAAQQAIDATAQQAATWELAAGQGRDEGVVIREVTGAHRGAAGAARQHGSTLKALLDEYPKYKDQVLASAGATSDAKAETVQLTAAQVKHVRADVAAKAALDALTEALDSNKNATLRLRGGESAWFAALGDVTKAVKDNGRTLDVHTEKGRANRQALDSLASAGLSYLGVIQQNNGVGAKFRHTLDQQWQKLYDAARRFGATKGEARKYADQILAVPRAQSLKVTQPGMPAARSNTQGYKSDIFKVPKSLALRVTAPGIAAARAGARGLASDIVHINGKTITVRYRSDGTVQIGTHIAQAAGGPVPGWSPSKTADNVPVMATAGEHMWTVDEVRGAGGHAGVERLRAAARAGALHLAAGGAVQRNLVTRYQGRFAQHVISDAVDAWIRQVVSGGGGGVGGGAPGGSGVRRWAPTILQALRLLGQSSSWLNTVERRMQRESGGNPTIVNRWDSNWKAGTPSVGLMQVIGPTFRGNAGRFLHTGPFLYGVSTNGLANTYAGLHYAIRRYGSLSALNRPGGYDGGGLLKPGLTLVANGTGRPERVLPPAETAAYERNLARVGHGGAAPVVVNLTLNAPHYVGDKNDLVRAMNDLSRQGRLDQIIRRAS